jgi:hypothetical protein
MAHMLTNTRDHEKRGGGASRRRHAGLDLGG